MNWGIIGAGIIANKMAYALKLSAGNHLHAVASKTASKARIFADLHGIPHSFTYQKIVECPEIDVIYVATTHNFHFENAKLALEHGKHVLVEKPFTVNATEAKELVRISRRKNLFLMEAIWTRFLPGMISMKAKVREGRIGKIKQINISYGSFAVPEYEGRLNSPALAGGVTLDLGIYAISFSCFLLEDIPVKIRSIPCFNNFGVDESSNYLFQFPSDCLTNVNVSYNLLMKNEAIVYGTTGFITFPNFPIGNEFSISVHDGSNNISKIMNVKEPANENGFIYQIQEVNSCIREGKMESKIISLSETIGIMEVMDKMRIDWGLKYPFE